MRFAKIVLSGKYREIETLKKGISSVTSKDEFRFDKFYIKTELISRKKDINKVIIDCRNDFSVSLFAGLEEIASRIVFLKESGKEVFFYASNYGVKELFLSSFCTYRLIHPLGSIKFQGLAQNFTFISRITRRLGIEAEVIRRGKYKSAGDRFRTEQLDTANKEQYKTYIENVMENIKTAITSGFEKTNDDIELLLDGRFIPAETAEDEGWIDEIVSCSAFINRWTDEKEQELKFKKIPDKLKNGFGLKSTKIAVLVFEGAIIDGYSKRDLIMGQAVGAESFIPEIKKLREDKSVKAVVLRINSGGGSAFASEDITAELRLLADKKPLVISMSEVAGSGGYWMSCCGIKTLALPTTLTGSIGVISIYINLHKLLSRLGLTHDVIKIGEHADMGSAMRSLSKKEKAMIDSEIEDMYKNFLKNVAGARNMKQEEVNKIALGRVWSGSNAKEIGLIDKTGGLTEAIAVARDASDIKKYSIQFYPEVKHGLIEKLLMGITKHDESARTISNNALQLISNTTENGINKKPLAVMESFIFPLKK